MTYKIPLIPPNLRKSETIVQIADSLDYLSRVVDDVMLHIENRVDSYSNKLKSVKNRIDAIEQKISQLHGCKNAIQVFSSTKYPAADFSRSYVSIFPITSEVPFKRHQLKQKLPRKNDEPLERLHIYHVQLSKLKPDKIEGFGPITNDIEHINDLLLFNSGKNLYKDFKVSNVRQVTKTLIKSEENTVNIGSAPESISNKAPYFNLNNKSYFYSPDLGEVPALDIPIDLPDLPGIAGNVRYQEDYSFGIAPSVMLSSTLSSKEVVSEDLREKLEGLPEIISSTPIVLDEGNSKMENSTVNEMKQEQSKISQEVVKNSQIECIVESNETSISLNEMPVTIDARASLMEAIRLAGGSKKLKSVNKETVVSNKNSSGDLMADLHAKLAMRRKGISGSQQNAESAGLDSRGALSLISAKIPAPEEINEETDVDEEWE